MRAEMQEQRQTLSACCRRPFIPRLKPVGFLGLTGKAVITAAEISGERYDMGVPFGYIQTQLALAMNSGSRRDVLAALAHLLTLKDLGSIRWD